MESFTITKKQYEALNKMRPYKRDGIILEAICRAFENDGNTDRVLIEEDLAIVELLLNK